MEVKLVRLLKADGTWDVFLEDWSAQCASYDEQIEEYATAVFNVVQEFIDTQHKEAGIFAVSIDGSHVAMFKANRAMIPGYATPVLRIRHLVVSPDYDFGDKTIEEYSRTLTSTLVCAIHLSLQDDNFKADHLKFHLASPADRQFFFALGKGINQSGAFQSVHSTGSWLYITK